LKEDRTRYLYYRTVYHAKSTSFSSLGFLNRVELGVDEVNRPHPLEDDLRITLFRGVELAGVTNNTSSFRLGEDEVVTIECSLVPCKSGGLEGKMDVLTLDEDCSTYLP